MRAPRHNDINIQDVGPRAVPGNGVFRVCSGGGRRVGRKGKAGKHGTQDIELSQKPRTYSHWFVDSDIGNREPWEKNELPKAIKYGKSHTRAQYFRPP